MNLYDPLRPLLAGSRPALADGSAVPRIMVLPLAGPAVELLVFLDMGGRSYSQHLIAMHENDLPRFLAEYRSDPEGTLLAYFAWTPPALRAHPHHTSRHVPTANPSTHSHNQEDLL